MKDKQRPGIPPIYPNRLMKGGSVLPVITAVLLVLAGAAFSLSYMHYENTPENILKEDHTTAGLLSFAAAADTGWNVFASHNKRGILVNDWKYYLYIFSAAFLIFLTISIFLLYLRKNLMLAETAKLLAAETRLREKGERSMQLFEYMNTGSAVYGAKNNGDDFIFKDLNNAAEKIDGVRREDVLGRSVPEVLPGVVDSGLFAVLQRVHSTGIPEKHPVSLYRDRRISGWREYYVYRLPSGEVAVMFDDVTGRKQAEEDIRRLNEGLEQTVAERTIELEVSNKELETFCYSVSHDLRSPLHVIDGFSQALLEDYQDSLDDQGKVYLTRVRAASQRMTQLIDDLLRLSRISRADIQKETVDLSALASATAQEIKDNNPGRGAVDFVIREGITVKGDRSLLGIAMMNLLQNAYKFTRNNPRARIEFGTAIHEGKQVFFVSDNGVGFDMKYADKLFGAFQRLHPKNEFEGTGIGLAATSRIIHRHGGRIWAEAVKEKGATFYFILGG